MSDHGESLGENGLYLHGVPYAFAPVEQTHVPALLWLPASEAERRSCAAARLQQPISHDFISHTVMGYTGVKTSVYKPEWDLLAGC
jgi:lipid A ethanolaminephosphotransferase